MYLVTYKDLSATRADIEPLDVCKRFYEAEDANLYALSCAADPDMCSGIQVWSLQSTVERKVTYELKKPAMAAASVTARTPPKDDTP